MPPTAPPDPNAGRFAFVVNGVHYESNQFRQRDGLRLSLMVAALGGEALVTALSAIASAPGGLKSVLDGSIGKVDLAGLRQSFKDGTIEAFLFDVLRQTYRAGIVLDVDKVPNGLDLFRPPTGNSFDLYAVALKVIVGNGWTPPLDGSLGELLATAKKAIKAKAAELDDSAQQGDGSATG